MFLNPSAHVSKPHYRIPTVAYQFPPEYSPRVCQTLLLIWVSRISLLAFLREIQIFTLQSWSPKTSWCPKLATVISVPCKTLRRSHSYHVFSHMSPNFLLAVVCEPSRTQQISPILQKRKHISRRGWLGLRANHTSWHQQKSNPKWKRFFSLKFNSVPCIFIKPSQQLALFSVLGREGQCSERSNQSRTEAPAV